MIDLSGVWLSYRPRGDRGQRHAATWALRDVDLSVKAGECVALVGPNGSGKSSLLRVAAGIYAPTRGIARLGRETGAVFDLAVGINRDLSGHQALEVYAATDGLTGARWRELQPKVVEATRLSDRVLRHALSTYSLGMLLRLQFALAIVERRSALVIDEVLAAADNDYRSWATEQIKELTGVGVAVLIASHDTSLTRGLAQRVAVLNNGAIEYEGPVADGLRAYNRLQKVQRGRAS